MAAAPGVAAAQDSVATSHRRMGYVTRAELEAQASQLEASGSADARADAASIRERLSEGDFKVGDRIVLSSSTTLSLPDQLSEALNSAHTLREGTVLRLTNLGDLSLAGVLRAELDSVVNTHVARSLRNVTVRAEPALQVMVTGPVQRPGFHTVPPDVTISDMLMSTAVPTGQADLSRMVLKRSGEEIIGADSLNAAVRSGATLDRIAFQSGDEFVIAERRERSLWRTAVQVIGVLGSLASAIFLIERISN